MNRWKPLVIIAILLGGCAAQKAEQERRMVIQLNESQVMVVTGDLDQPYKVLGQINYTEPVSGETIDDYLLPVSFRALVALGLRRVLARGEILAQLIPSRLRLRQPRCLAPPASSAQVYPGTRIPRPPSDAYALASLIDEDGLEWLARAPREIGDLVTLNFVVGGAPVGISISRVVPHRAGLTAKLLHLQVAPQSSALIGWIVSETCHHLIGRGVGLITCRFSCPMVGSALRQVGFLRSHASRVLVVARWNRATWCDAPLDEPGR